MHSLKRKRYIPIFVMVDCEDWTMFQIFQMKIVTILWWYTIGQLTKMWTEIKHKPISSWKEFWKYALEMSAIK